MKTPLGFSSHLVSRRNLLVPFSRHWFVVCYFLHSLGWLGHDCISQSSPLLFRLYYLYAMQWGCYYTGEKKIGLCFICILDCLKEFCWHFGGWWLLFLVSGSFLLLSFPCQYFLLCLTLLFCFYVSFKSLFWENKTL